MPAGRGAPVLCWAALKTGARTGKLLDDRPFLRVLPALVSLRVAVYLFTFVYWRMTAGGEPGALRTLVKLWSRWDALHYVQIAEHGYAATGDLASNIAFFPLYPAVLALGHAVLPFVPTVLVGMLVSKAASLAGLGTLHRLAARRWDATVADRAVIYVSLFPTAYFFLAAYTEGLFFLFVVAAFVYLDEERWLAAALASACASATRLSGALVALAWLAQWIRRRGWRPTLAMWPIVIAPAGLYAYLVLNQVVCGDPLRFLEVQRVAWHHELATPWHGFGVLFEYLTAPARDLRAWWYRDVPELVAALAGYLGSIAVFSRVGLAEGLYCLGSVVLWTSNTWWMSGPRFCLVLFPLFLLVASRRLPQAVHRALWAASAVAQAVLATVFIGGRWAF